MKSQKFQFKTALMMVGMGVIIITTNAQNVSISATGVAPDNSAGLDVNFSDKGLLIPRVALSSATDGATIPSPANSLLVYNTGTGGLAPAGYYYNAGTPGSPSWRRLLVSGTPSDAWLTLGNAGTNPATHFIGTTDNTSLVFRTNNTERMRILNTGYVGIGTAFPGYNLDIYTTTNWGGARLSGNQNVQFVFEAPNGFIPQCTFVQSGITRFTQFIDFNGNFWGIGRFNNAGAYLDTPLSIDRATGNVGIKVTTPQRNLEIINDVTGISFEAGSGTPNSGVIRFGDNTGWKLHFGRSRDAVGGALNSGTSGVLMTIVDNGNVGIGTTTPATGLHLHRDNAHAVFRITSNNTNYSQGIQVGVTNGWFFGRAATSEDFVINRDVPLGSGTNVFRIYAAGNPRMSHFVSRNSGFVGNGTNNDGPTNVIIDAGNGPGRYNDWPNGWGGGLSTWDICGASTYMSGYATRSDKRYKRDINEFGSDVLTNFMKIRPVQYYINTETLKVDDPERLRFGFIANEIEQIFPNLVINAGLPDSIARGLEYDGFIPLLVKVVQEQQKQIEQLKVTNESLKKENAELKMSLQQQNNLLLSEIQKLKAHIGMGEAKK